MTFVTLPYPYKRRRQSGARARPVGARYVGTERSRAMSGQGRSTTMGSQINRRFGRPVTNRTRPVRGAGIFDLLNKRTGLLIKPTRSPPIFGNWSDARFGLRKPNLVSARVGGSKRRKRGGDFFGKLISPFKPLFGATNWVARNPGKVLSYVDPLSLAGAPVSMKDIMKATIGSDADRAKKRAANIKRGNPFMFPAKGGARKRRGGAKRVPKGPNASVPAPVVPIAIAQQPIPVRLDAGEKRDWLQTMKNWAPPIAAGVVAANALAKSTKILSNIATALGKKKLAKRLKKAGWGKRKAPVKRRVRGKGFFGSIGRAFKSAGETVGRTVRNAAVQKYKDAKGLVEHPITLFTKPSRILNLASTFAGGPLTGLAMGQASRGARSLGLGRRRKGRGIVAGPSFQDRVEMMARTMKQLSKRKGRGKIILKRASTVAGRKNKTKGGERKPRGVAGPTVRPARRNAPPRRMMA